MKLSRCNIFFVLTIIFLVPACSNEGEKSPYSEMLSQPKYASLTDSIKKDPKNEELYFRRAILLNSNDLPEPALADFLKAWSLQQNEKYALGASTILLDKKPDSAIRFISTALKKLPESLLLKLSLARAKIIAARQMRPCQYAMRYCSAIHNRQMY
ncbi:MAG: hypothetical protein IPH18_15065 [Chitinophagaceae bacterium]|nr:hypothetical protein [Chitinophagaceae bacterium]